MEVTRGGVALDLLAAEGLSSGPQPDLASIASTHAIAVLFQPLRERILP